MTSTHLIRESILDAAAVLLPVRCSGCGRPDRGVCAECARALRPETVVADGSGLPLFAALVYEGVVRRVLLAFKDGGRTDAAAALSVALGEAFVAAQANVAPDTRSALVPVLVPSTRAAFRRRGYHPTALILRRSRILVPPLWRALRLTRQTEDQAGLNARERADNRRGSLIASGRLRQRDCLIVDDIVTTGSTVREAARAIDAVGGRVVGAVAVARTPLRAASPTLS
jgi:predicted amidophosphoribosyltransferase